MILQPIVNIAEICAQKSIFNIILSPGSRCAPLTIAFVRHPKIKTLTVSDERSAAFIALGMAQQLKRATGLVCTSGSAAYNYAPAVAEAYFQQIPLLILTADRPPEWIDQQDGQTIRQRDIFGKHVKKSFELPVSYEHPDVKWQVERTLSEAINLSMAYPAGPVHINIPLREPFYPADHEEISFDKKVKVIENTPCQPTLSNASWQTITREWQRFDRKLIIGGQMDPCEVPSEEIAALSSLAGIPVVGDIISNLHGQKPTIRYPDIFLAKKDEALLKKLQPELLITYGNSVISKNLKLFIRKYRPKAHWHIQPPGGEMADPFQTLTRVIQTDPSYFFKEITERVNMGENGSFDYKSNWIMEEKKAKEYIGKFNSNLGFGEFQALKTVMSALPSKCVLHLANSMSVRYANFIGLPEEKRKVEVYANRGTSGIDGSTSTAVGAALAGKELTILITGDLAFFYDRNGLWHNYLPENLRIVLLNNHAGGIFGLIDGPARQPELEEYFETRQQLNAVNTAKDFGLTYYHSKDAVSLQNQLADFFKLNGKAKILEIETDKYLNRQVFNEFKLLINKNYEA